MIINKYNSCWC